MSLPLPAHPPLPEAAAGRAHPGDAVFRQLIENGPDLVMIASPELGLTYVNPSAERLLGYAPAELLGRVPADLLHPDDAAALSALLGAVQAEPTTVRQVTWRIRHKAGGWRVMEAHTRMLAPDDPAAGFLVTARDVTERRAMEDALRASEERFRTLVENGSDLLMISRADGPLTYVSPSAERLLGYRPSEMLGRMPTELAHPDDLDALWDGLRRIVAEPGVVHAFAVRLRHKDGSWRALEALGRTVAPDSADDGIVANSRDVTEQRAAEAALQRSEERFRALVENAYDLTSISTADGHVAYMSPSVLSVLGYTPAELEGQWAFAYIHPDDAPHVGRELARLVAEPGAVGHAEYRFRHKDGSWRLLEAFARTLSRESADEGLVLNVRDVTERRRTEAALRRAKADAEQAREEADRANRAKSEFLSRMSHELRTPLNSILGFAQLLEDVELPADDRAGVRHILNGGRHLLGLINEVLDIARIEAGEQSLSLEPVRVQAAVREALDMVRPLAQARGVALTEAPTAAADRYVRADRQRLVQVLLNLLSNAVKYNREGGAVRIDAAVVSDAAAGERVRVRVHDEGSGIAPDQRDQLFVPFARLGAERTGVEGTGLGLALSQRLAHAMGGALALEASGPGGSVFAVELPAAEDPLAGAPALGAAAVRTADGAGTPATLLYVEDNLANLTLVESVLLRSRPEWRVIPALQGRLGVALAREHAPDLVLLDLHLPDLHGAEVLAELRADARTAATPVVVVSADATPRTVEALAAAGADAFLTKPLDVRQFVQTVERLLARRAHAS